MDPEDETQKADESLSDSGFRSSSDRTPNPDTQAPEQPIPLEDLFLIARALDVFESTGFHWSRADAFGSWFERCLDRTWEHFDTLSLRPHEVLQRLAASEAHAAQKNYDKSLQLLEEALVLIQAISHVEQRPAPLIDPLTARVTRVLRSMLRDDLPSELSKSVSQLTQSNQQLLEEARRLLSQSQSPLRQRSPQKDRQDPFAARAQRANIDSILSESPVLQEKIESAVQNALLGAFGSDDFQARLNSMVARRAVETLRGKRAVQWIKSIASVESRREIEENFERNADEIVKRSKQYTGKKLGQILPQIDDELQEVSNSMGELNTSLLGVSSSVEEVSQSVDELTNQLDKQGGLFTKQGQSLAGNIESLRDRLAEIEQRQIELEEADEPFDDDRVLRIVKRFVITREAVQLEERKKLEKRIHQFENDFDWSELITDVLQSEELETKIVSFLADFKKREIDAKKKRRQHTKDQVRKVVEEHLAKKEVEEEDFIEAEVASPLPTKVRPQRAPQTERTQRPPALPPAPSKGSSKRPALPPAPSRGSSKRTAKGDSKSSGRRKSTRISGRRRRR
ncbi:MAG: hypothetical protein P1V97_32035 [Planctomycetota bacterium]|nr:hypothetical protein [Planctomycetota bacterium]